LLESEDAINHLGPLREPPGSTLGIQNNEMTTF
jgi:hypothetical protein